jgi:hypothetical protein
MPSNATSKLSPSDDFTHDKFFVEFIYRSSIQDNITSWRIFDDDYQIIYFLHFEDTFRGSVIYTEQHETLLQALALEDKPEYSNIMPKNIIRLEKLFDLQDKFKNSTNTKINSSSLKYKVVNLGIEKNPQNINLRNNCSPSKRESFINLFKEYKDVFSWTYHDLKTYDTNIIQYIIPMKEYLKPF